MRKFILLMALLTCCLVQLSAETLLSNPVADPTAVVTSGRARFTVLTPEMIRIQYSSSAKFEDRATFAVVNRRLPVPAYTTREEDGYLYIETEALTLCYKKNSIISPQYQKPDNLHITFKVGGHQVVWYPGKEDALNLKGTKRTLDNASGDNQRDGLENGVISRAGWAVIDESPATKRGDGSTTFAFDKQVDGIDWVATPVDKNAIDMYFMGYGHEYKKAIGDYIKIAGRQPMPPLYALGYWYSKYQRYSQSDFMNLTNEIKQNDIPIDVMIMDMDWHLDGWTGWTWNKNLISNPEGLLRWMHQQGLKVSLNLHPADGVASYEEHFAEIRDDMGLPASTDRVPWQLEDSTFYRAMFKHIIRDRERQGVDFWWLDWQQNLTSHYLNGLGETFWCNHVFYNDMRQNRPDRRPITICVRTVLTVAPSSSTAGVDWALTAIPSASRATPMAPLARWPSSLTSRLPPPTSALAIGAMTSVVTYRLATPTQNSCCAGCSLASSRPSSAPMVPVRQATSGASGSTRISPPC